QCAGDLGTLKALKHGVIIAAYSGMKFLPRKILALTLFGIAVASPFSVRPAQAFTETLQQVGANVVATGSGAIDLNGLSFVQVFSTSPGTYIRSGDALLVTGPGNLVDGYTGFSGPTNFGPSFATIFGTSGSGDEVAIWAGGLILAVPQFYLTGAP